MKSLSRLAAGVAALVAVSLVATACDASPFAAKVNSQAIKQTALNTELRAWAANTDYVTAFDTANSANNGGSGVTVAGDSAGTYNTTWVADILGGMIQAEAIQQRLRATGQVPTPGVEVAATSISALSRVGWDRFPPAFRQTLVSRLADQATLTPTSVPAATLLSVYNRNKPSFFTQVCVVQAAAFSHGQAAGLAAAGVPNGTRACYGQVQFEAQSPAFQGAVLALPVGQVAPLIATSYGYQVVRVVSRTLQGFTPDVQRVLSLAITISQGTPDPVLDGLLTKSRVQVDPAYGTWKVPQIVPPTPPGASA